MALVLTVLASFFTAALSAVLGVAGGVALMAVMLTTLPAAAVIPVHGVAQLVSNTSRFLLMLKSVEWPIFFRFLVGLIPASFVGVSLSGLLSEVGLKTVMATFILISTWFPVGGLAKLLGSRQSFIGAGMLTGIVSMLVGAAGPMLAPFFLQTGLNREAMIATQAACQFFQHLIKIVLFGLILDFDYLEYSTLLICLALAAIAGTIAGRKFLQSRLNEEQFRKALKIVLTLIALKILIFDVILQGV